MKNKDLMGKRVRVLKIYQWVRRRRVGYQHQELVEKLALDAFNKPQTGWIVGFRSIPDFRFTYDEGLPVIESTGGRKVALIALTPNTKPYYVPLDGFEIEED
jgi:hypothetical protein